MIHAEFLAAYARGEVKVELDAKGAARFLSARLLLPFVMMPVLGIGVAAALVGWIYTGFTIIALGIVVPQLIKRSAPRFLLHNALADERTYLELTQANILHITPITAGARES